MPNCAISIPNWETNGKPLSPEPIDVSFNMIKNDTLYFELSNTQTVYMYFNLKNSGGLVNYMISIYDALTLNLVSTVNSTSLNLSTNIDLLSGVYIVCLRSLSGAYTGTVRADYYGFGRVITFAPEVGESGSGVDFDLKIEPKRKECDKDMIWSVVEGKLPPGLQLDYRTGLIYGVLPYLDCLEDEDDPFNNVPSVNLFYSSGVDKCETIEPWGRRWNFKLRIAIREQPEHYDERWFCILIYNNWSRSQKKFISEYDNGIVYGNIIKDVDQHYDIGLCENVCVESKSIDIIDEVVKDFINSEIMITDEDNILHIEIPEIPEFDSINPNTVEIYTRIDGEANKRKVIIENDGTNYFGAYTNYQTTIEMDPDILNQRNVYIPEIQAGYVSEDIMIEIESYEHYLSFRQYSRLMIEDNESEIYEYKDNKLFNDFMNIDSNVNYEYLSYKSEEDELKTLHYIYIYYNNIKLPEVEKIKKLNTDQLEKSPIMFEFVSGERSKFELTTNEEI